MFTIKYLPFLSVKYKDCQIIVCFSKSLFYYVSQFSVKPFSWPELTQAILFLISWYFLEEFSFFVPSNRILKRITMKNTVMSLPTFMCILMPNVALPRKQKKIEVCAKVFVDTAHVFTNLINIFTLSIHELCCCYFIYINFIKYIRSICLLTDAKPNCTRAETGFFINMYVLWNAFSFVETQIRMVGWNVLYTCN